MKRKNGDNNTLRWLIGSAKGKKRYVAILVVIQAVSAAINIFSALFMAGIIDSAVARDWDTFRFYCMLEVAKVIVQTLLTIMRHYLEEYTKASLENNLKKRLFRNILIGDYATVTAVHSGEWMTRLTSDAAVVANGMTGILPGLVGMAVRLVLSLCLVVSIAPVFGGSLVCQKDPEVVHGEPRIDLLLEELRVF